MEISQLCSILEACMSPNQQQRAAAEQTLEQFQHAKGQLVMLLRIAVEPTLGPEVRQSAAISFKNLVKTGWKPVADANSPIPEEDKQSVRENLLESIIRAPAPVRLQLGECLRAIVWADYPEKWPQLLPLLTQNLTAQDQSRVYGCMFALRILTRKFEFRGSEERVALDQIVDATFPSVLQLVQQLLASNTTSLEAAETLKLALKSFWSAMYMGIPSKMLLQDQFAGWMTAFHTILSRPVPQEGQPEDIVERKSWPWWKVYKWVLNILNRLYSRYSDPRTQHAKGSNERQFGEMWVSICSQQFLEDYMAIAARLTQGEFIVPRAVNLLLQYLTHAISVKQSWKFIKPHVPTLLTNCVFPLLCFDDEDAELWQDDPQEYIRKGYDLIEDMYSAKTAAVNFVVEVCKQRPKGNLDYFMQFIVQVMTDFQAALAAGSVTEQQARRMDGALLSIGSLNDIALKRKEPYKDRLEPMLVQFIIPLFGSKYGHLRAKACWMAGQFASIDFAEGSGSGATFNTLFSKTVTALQDPELPVRVDAVVALRNLVDSFDEDHLADIKPHIGKLLEHLFNLMAEIENEDLVFTLETIVEKFGEDIAPYAVALCQHLTTAFWRLKENGFMMQQMQASDASDESEEDEGALAAFGCLRALSTVLESVSSLPELFPVLEPVVFPVLQRMVSQQGQDVFEEITEILSYFTYFSPQISTNLWSLWPQLYQAYNEWAFDYFENILVPLDNFISRGTDVFLSGQNPNYLSQAIHMAEKALTDSDASEGDVICAPKLLEIILQNCRGRVDPCVPHFINLALSRLGTVKRKNLKDQLVNVVANALYYNPSMALHHLQQCSQMTSFMNAWFQMIFAVRKDGRRRFFRRQHDKKVSALALTSLIALPGDALPQELQTYIAQLSAGSVKLLADLHAQKEAFAAAESEEEGSTDASGSGSDEDELEDDADEEDENASAATEDEAYMRRLSREAAKLAGVEGEPSGSDDEWTDDEEESGPLDDVDPFIYFSNALKQLQVVDPPRFNAATANMDQKEGKLVLETAEINRAKKSVIGQ